MPGYKTQPLAGTEVTNYFVNLASKFTIAQCNKTSPYTKYKNIHPTPSMDVYTQHVNAAKNLIIY